jgi:hypothetical protein
MPERKEQRNVQGSEKNMAKPRSDRPEEPTHNKGQGTSDGYYFRGDAFMEVERERLEP